MELRKSDLVVICYAKYVLRDSLELFQVERAWYGWIVGCAKKFLKILRILTNFNFINNKSQWGGFLDSFCFRWFLVFPVLIQKHRRRFLKVQK